MTGLKIAKQNFRQAIEEVDQWATIDELVVICDEAGVWPEDFIDGALDRAKKAFIRQQIKQQKDGDNWPLWASVETQNEEGETVRIYKQEMLFDPEDYRQVVAYHADRQHYHATMATGYADRCERRFHVQLALPFEDFNRQKPRAK